MIKRAVGFSLFMGLLLLSGCDAQPSDESISQDGNGAKTKIGGIITFGSYEQDGDTNNGQEPIEWRVLAVENDHALIISDKLLDAKAYNRDFVDITWEKCTLRSWLNERFAEAAFTAEEKEAILVTDLVNEGNREYAVDGGNPTQDKIFLLSIDEAKRYFSGDDDKIAFTTPYAEKQGVGVKKGKGWWWLRSPGDDAEYTMCVRHDGSFFETGRSVHLDYNGVRPALWLDMSI
jgi:hypothetical protein